MKFLVVIEPTDTGFSARAPDVDGCVARGRTRDQVERQIRAALEFQIATLRHAGEAPPTPRAYATEVAIVAAEPERVLSCIPCDARGSEPESASGP